MEELTICVRSRAPEARPVSKETKLVIDELAEELNLLLPFGCLSACEEAKFHLHVKNGAVTSVEVEVDEWVIEKTRQAEADMARAQAGSALGSIRERRIADGKRAFLASLSAAGVVDQAPTDEISWYEDTNRPGTWVLRIAHGNEKRYICVYWHELEVLGRAGEERELLLRRIKEAPDLPAGGWTRAASRASLACPREQ